MIVVRIPDEIKKYKEKVLFGLTARQLLAVIALLVTCVPLFIYGRKFLGDDLMGWLIIIIACPIGAVGFIKFRGGSMPAEKFVAAFFKQAVLYPPKRRYKTVNAFRTWENTAKREDLAKMGGQRKVEKLELEKSLERAVLMEEAQARGDFDFDVDSAELITVSASGGGKKPDKNKKDKSQGRKNEKSKLQILAEEIEDKVKSDPHYLPTKRENEIRKKWNLQYEKQKKQEMAQKKKAMSVKSSQMKKRRTAKTTIPKSAQQSIPYIADYDEGLFEVAPNKYSKVYRLHDINYKTSKEEEQVTIFNRHGEFLNHFDEDVRFAFCIDNRVVSLQEQERQVFYSMTGDSYDKHRVEYNNFLRRQIMIGHNDIQVEKFLTVTVDAATPIEALFRFHKIDLDVINNLKVLRCVGKVLTTEERLSYYHDKFRKGREGELNIDFNHIKQYGISSKDYIAPSCFDFSNNKYFMIDDTYCRVLYLSNLPKSLSDEFLHDLCKQDFPVTVTLNIQPVAQDKGLRIVQKQLTGIEKDKIEAEKKAIRGGYDPNTIRHEIKDALAQAEALYDDMVNKDQKMFYVTVTCLVQGNTMDELNENCKTVEGKAREKMAQLLTLSLQQEEGYKITLPFGYPPKNVCVERTLTTDSTAIFMPYSNTELLQKGGYYYGLNQISNNLIVVDRLSMKTPSGFILGSSGSGKSFACKREILNVLLHDDKTSVLIIDPEREYVDFCRAFGGTVLKISTDSEHFINPMDMPEDYGLDEDDDAATTSMATKKSKAIRKKSELIMSIVERMISVGGDGDTSTVKPVQKTIIDRSLKRAYAEYLDHDFDTAYLPTLMDLQNELDKEKGTPEGAEVATAVEYYTRGSMNVFSHKTNVDLDNRFVVFNVRDLGEQLKQIALIIVFDFIWNRMVENKNRGVRTYC